MDGAFFYIGANSISARLKQKQYDSQILKQTSQYHKDMENAVHPPQFLAQTEQHRTDGIGDATCQQPIKTLRGHYRHCLGQEKDNAPTHKDITNHRKNLVLTQIYGGQRYSQSSQTPFHNQKSPGDLRKNGEKTGNHNGGVGAGDEKIDGAVVNHLHNLLGSVCPQTVIDAGHCVNSNHRYTVDDSADEINGAKVTCRQQTEDAAEYGQTTADNMGYHIHNFFACGIVGELPQ